MHPTQAITWLVVGLSATRAHCRCPQRHRCAADLPGCGVNEQPGARRNRIVASSGVPPLEREAAELPLERGAQRRMERPLDGVGRGGGADHGERGGQEHGRHARPLRPPCHRGEQRQAGDKRGERRRRRKRGNE